MVCGVTVYVHEARPGLRSRPIAQLRMDERMNGRRRVLGLRFEIYFLFITLLAGDDEDTLYTDDRECEKINSAALS